jgi:heme-degrading monooxygenase HmoA
MGLKELFQRWTKSEDARAVERAEEESRMTPYERDVDREDFEARKDDLLAGRDRAGADALDVADDDLH